MSGEVKRLKHFFSVAFLPVLSEERFESHFFISKVSVLMALLWE
jgi:hypothetical protein